MNPKVRISYHRAKYEKRAVILILLKGLGESLRMTVRLPIEALEKAGHVYLVKTLV